MVHVCSRNFNSSKLSYLSLLPARMRMIELKMKELECSQYFSLYKWGPPGVLGIWGEGLFIFRELGSTAYYFQGAGEQAHTFGDLGSTAKK